MLYGPYPDVYLPSYMFFQNLGSDIEQLRRIFDLLPLGAMVTNSDGIITYYNRAHAKLDNLTQQEVLGRPEPEVFGFPDFSPGIMRACQKMRRPILGFMCPYYTLKNPSRIIKGAYWVFPLFDADKKVTGSLCLTMPITDDHGHKQVKHLMWPESMPLSKAPKKIIGENEQLLKAIDTAKNRANSPSSVLISGETGTGKELFARLIHESSPRADKPLIAINCAAIPEHLLEGLLFGTTKGSFTGAVDRAGLFEEANGGTIYLDEIDSMPIGLQPKLLRVLQEMKVCRLGSRNEIKLDIKIISSIGTPIHEVMVKEKLRPDLFYRLAVIVINVPPLRERTDDIEELMNYFISKYNKILAKRVVGFDMPTKNWLKKYSWPGNVRELENLVAGSINLADNNVILGREQLPDHYLYLMEQQEAGNVRSLQAADINGKPQPTQMRNSVTRVMAKVSKHKNSDPQNAHEEEEAKIIGDHLLQARGRLIDAAASLGISRQLLGYKMKKYGLKRHDFLPRLGKDNV